MQKARKNEISDAVILDVDTNTLITDYDDFEDLPSEIVSYTSYSDIFCCFVTIEKCCHFKREANYIKVFIKVDSSFTYS